MKKYIVKFSIISILISVYSCKTQNHPESTTEEIWKLGWRMVENSWDENYDLAELQFDSLLSINKPIDEAFLMYGLKFKTELSKKQEVIEIIAKQPKEMQAKICEKQFAKGMKPCLDYPEEKVENKALQLEIIKLFLRDQAIRGNVMEDIISKYQLDTPVFKPEEGMSYIDEMNRERLKDIFKKFGFPTRKLIGQDAMNGVFFIIQHADGDPEWQKSQLSNIELAATNGDLTTGDYAYLYDRIKVNHGEPQKYGSQFAKVDREHQIAELRDTEDVANLNTRRREMGMMPIEMYRRLILRD